MKTQIEQVALLSKFNCCYAELAGKVASKLGKYKLCNLKSELREMKLARAYIYRIHKYNTLIAEPYFGVLITFERPDSKRISITITIGGTKYGITNTTANLQTIIDNFLSQFEVAGFEVEQYGDNGIIVYSMNSAHEGYEVTGVITANPAQTTNTITVTDYVDTIVSELLDETNCLTREEICGIINQTCCILDKYCTN